MPSPRERRLQTDFEAISRLTESSDIIEFHTSGTPAEYYLVTFNGKGLYRDDNQTVKVIEKHQVEIKFTVAYPRVKPDIYWRSKIFHPNISASGLVCLGGYGSNWVPSLNLDELVEMLWDICRYDNYDIQSPYNHEAARWARSQSLFKLPLDSRPLRNKLAEGRRDQNVISVSGMKKASPKGSKSPVSSAKTSPPPEDGILFIGADDEPEQPPTSDTSSEDDILFIGFD